MKVAVLLCLAIVAAVTARNNQSHYTTRDDNFNVDQVINNDKLMSRYVRCLLCQLMCHQEGLELKHVLADALATGCAKCNDREREASMKIISHLMNNKKEWWNALEAKYDLTDPYRRQLLTN